jgi:hypothetical protein
MLSMLEGEQRARAQLIEMAEQVVLYILTLSISPSLSLLLLPFLSLSLPPYLPFLSVSLSLFLSLSLTIYLSTNTPSAAVIPF